MKYLLVASSFAFALEPRIAVVGDLTKQSKETAAIVESFISTSTTLQISSRATDDIESLKNEMYFNKSEIVSDSNTSKLSLEGVNFIIKVSDFKLSTSDIDPSDRRMILKMIAYPSGRLLGSSEPLVLDKEASYYKAQAAFLINSPNSIKAMGIKPLSTPTPTWAKICGYLSIAAAGLSGYELLRASSSYKDHQGAVTQTRSDASYKEYQQQRNVGLTSGVVALGLLTSFTIGF